MQKQVASSRAKRKTEYKKSGLFNTKSTSLSFSHLRLAVCLVVFGMFAYTVITQQVNLVGIRRETAECQKQIAVQKDKYARLKEKAKYNSTDEFYEEAVRDEGYVRDDETVFVIGN